MAAAPLPAEDNWSEEAKNILKSEIKRRGMTYADLVKALERTGLKESEANLRNKISRGNFSAAFFLQCLYSINCPVVYLRSLTLSPELIDFPPLHANRELLDALGRTPTPGKRKTK